MLLRADEVNDDVIESFSLYYVFSVFPSFVFYYHDCRLFFDGGEIRNLLDMEILPWLPWQPDTAT